MFTGGVGFSLVGTSVPNIVIAIALQNAIDKFEDNQKYGGLT